MKKVLAIDTEGYYLAVVWLIFFCLVIKTQIDLDDSMFVIVKSAVPSKLYFTRSV